MTTIIEELPVLYKLKKNKGITRWQMSVRKDDVGVFLFVEMGQVGGAVQSFRKDVTEGKNLGKSNETTIEVQAVNEAISTYRSKKDGGYTQKENGVSELVYTLPMLAHSYMEYRDNIVWPRIAQFKLDGIRCLAKKVSETKVLLRTRKGKEIVGFRHIRKDLLRIMEVGQEFDGELYNHGMTLQQIASIVRKTVNGERAEQEKLQYHIFDVVDPEATTEERINVIEELTPSNHVFVVYSTVVFSEDETEELFLQAEEMGYEGLMLRDPAGLYEIDSRTQKLLKFKKFIDAEFKIVGAREGRGKDKGTCVFLCTTRKGGIFKVRMVGDLKTRKYYWEHHQEYFGKMVTVKFQTYTDDYLPEFPVGLEIRDYE